MLLIREKDSKNECFIYYDHLVDLYIDYRNLFYRLRYKDYNKIIGNYSIYKRDHSHITTNFTNKEIKSLCKKILNVPAWTNFGSLANWFDNLVEYLGETYDVKHGGIC